MKKYEIEETVAFTGHRLISTSKVDKVKEELRSHIKALYLKGIRTYLSGMALGFDMLAAEVILSMKKELPSLKLIAVVPFREQCRRWNYRDQARYNAILEAADETILLSDGYFDKCYLKRNDFMIAHSCGLIAYYDGSYKGGTFYTFRKAKMKGLNIINLF